MNDAADSLTRWIDANNTLDENSLQKFKQITVNATATTESVKAWFLDTSNTITNDVLQFVKDITKSNDVTSMSDASTALHNWLSWNTTLLSGQIQSAQRLTGNNSVTTPKAAFNALKSWVNGEIQMERQNVIFVRNFGRFNGFYHLENTVLPKVMTRNQRFTVEMMVSGK